MHPDYIEKKFIILQHQKKSFWRKGSTSIHTGAAELLVNIKREGDGDKTVENAVSSSVTKNDGELECNIINYGFEWNYFQAWMSKAASEFLLARSRMGSAVALAAKWKLVACDVDILIKIDFANQSSQWRCFLSEG